MALLGGRGGADGQAVVRRIRDPNASSGQRQVFVGLAWGTEVSMMPMAGAGYLLRRRPDVYDTMVAREVPE